MSLVKFPKTLSDHPSLIGIIRFPKAEVETTKMVIPYIEENNGKFTQKGQEIQMALAIYGEEKTSNTFSIHYFNGGWLPWGQRVKHFVLKFLFDCFGVDFTNKLLTIYKKVAR